MSAQLRDIDWWYWAAVTLLLASGLLGVEPALGLAYLLCAARTVQLALAARDLAAFSVQVNVAFLAILVTAAFATPRLVFGAALLTASVQVLTGYSVIARLLALLPVNRHEPLSLVLLKRTLCTAPVRGSILQLIARREGQDWHSAVG